MVSNGINRILKQMNARDINPEKLAGIPQTETLVGDQVNDEVY